MLTEICQESRNGFDRDLPKWHGDFTFSDGEIVLTGNKSIKEGQYFRIVGSVLNDGVYCYGNAELGEDEAFSGSVWAMAVPPAVIALSKEIDEWVKKNVDVITSPFSSESFGGYAYTKIGGGVSRSGASKTGSSGGIDWRSVFGARLNRWRKI